MKKNKTIRLISFLIIVFLAFQLIPSSINHYESLQNHTQRNKIFLPSSLINLDVLSFVRQNGKTSFQNIPTKSPSDIIHQEFSFDVTVENSFILEEPFDYRRVIRQCIPHYFNGSKYKSEYFDI